MKQRYLFVIKNNGNLFKNTDDAVVNVFVCKIKGRWFNADHSGYNSV